MALLAKAGCSQMFVGVESFSRPTLLAARKGQNRPETYRDIVRLCREHGIKSHFSNIIGFPQDTERDVDRHLEMLRELGPTFASFYILCPIPGTEQYDEFAAEGLITEDNLDRFDTTCLTWRHPHFSREQLAGLLFRCYRQFFSSGHAVRNLMHLSWLRSGVLAESAGDHGHVAVHSVLRVEADPSHVRRGRARAAGPRGRLPRAAQGSVRLRAGSTAAQPAIVGGGQLAEPGPQSARAGEFATRRPAPPPITDPVAHQGIRSVECQVGILNRRAAMATRRLNSQGPPRGPIRRGTSPHRACEIIGFKIPDSGFRKSKRLNSQDFSPFGIRNPGMDSFTTSQRTLRGTVALQNRSCGTDHLVSPLTTLAMNSMGLLC